MEGHKKRGLRGSIDVRISLLSMLGIQLHFHYFPEILQVASNDKEYKNGGFGGGIIKIIKHFNTSKSTG